MSAVLFTDDIEFLQRLLCAAGCYQTPFSGVWDPATDAAEQAFFVTVDAIADEAGEFDQRSERNIRTLHPSAQRRARRFLTTLRRAGIDARILSGTRTYAEQNLLFRRGRFGNPPPRVTNARGGKSNHNFGIAWDVGIFDHGAYLPDSPLYDTAASLAKTDRLEWGGDWKTFMDRPHYQLATGLTIDEVRTRFEQGLAFV